MQSKGWARKSKAMQWRENTRGAREGQDGGKERQGGVSQRGTVKKGKVREGKVREGKVREGKARQGSGIGRASQYRQETGKGRGKRGAREEQSLARRARGN